MTLYYTTLNFSYNMRRYIRIFICGILGHVSEGKKINDRTRKLARGFNWFCCCRCGFAVGHKWEWSLK